MSTDEQDRIRAYMLLKKEKTERSLKCCQGKAYHYGKTLMLLASVLDDPTNKETWEHVREEMDIPKQVAFGTVAVERTAWLPEIPPQSDIVRVLKDIQHYTEELERITALLA